MSEMTPNHICKNPNCHKGKDGERKKYYACRYCDKSFNWRSVACSFECYQEYMNAVIEERSKNKEVKVVPERIDMTETEVEELMNKPTEVVLEETKEELKEYINKDGSADFAKIVDTINAEVDNMKTTTTRGRKKKNTDE